MKSWCIGVFALGLLRSMNVFAQTSLTQDARINPVGVMSRNWVRDGDKIIIAKNEFDPHSYTNCRIVSRYISGDPDTTFGRNGMITDFADHRNIVTTDIVALQRDGKIIIAGRMSDSLGNSRCLLTRYTAWGERDASFGRDGNIVVSEFDRPGDLLIQPDGKILIMGWDGALIRYSSLGTVDRSFGQEGMVPPQGMNATTIVLQPDGKILMGGNVMKFNGYTDLAVTRLFPNGSIDKMFGIDGLATFTTDASSTAWKLALDAEGRIIAAGDELDIPYNRNVVIARFNNNGILDNSFYNHTVSFVNFNNYPGVNISILPNGKIMLGKNQSYSSDQENGVIIKRLDANGNADNTFNNYGEIAMVFSMEEAPNNLFYLFDKETLNRLKVSTSNSIMINGQTHTYIRLDKKK